MPNNTVQNKGYFKGLDKAETYGRGNYMDADKLYKLKVVRTFIQETKAKGDAFIAEFEVVESNSDKHPKGTKVSWYQSLLSKDIAYAELKKFMYAVLGVDENKDSKRIATEIDPGLDEAMNEAVNTNALEGAVIKCQTQGITTKAKGLPFTRHNWSVAA